MKKLATLLLALMMMSGACLAEDTDEQIALAVYDLIGITVGDVPTPEEELPFVTAFFFNDHTFTLYQDDDVYTGTYDASDEHEGFVVTLPDLTIDFIMDPETDYLYIINEKTAAQAIFAPHVDLPATINAESMEDFQGIWHINAALELGHPVDLTDADDRAAVFGTTDPVIVIDGDHVNVLDGQLEGIALFVDGALTVIIPGGEIVIEMTEDGGIVCPAPEASELVSLLYAVK